MFNEAKYILNQRSKELNTIIKHLETMDAMTSAIHKASIIMTSAIHKASIIMMLYNVIEGTFYVLLKEVFDYAKNNPCGLPEAFYITIAEYHAKQIFEKGQTKKNKNSWGKELLKFKERESIPIPTLDSIKPFSGNLDAKSIRDISKNYGVVIKYDLYDNEILFIKDKRNALSHGNVSYAQAGRDRTLKEIKCHKIATIKCLKNIIKSFEQVYSDIKSAEIPAI